MQLLLFELWEELRKPSFLYVLTIAVLLNGLLQYFSIYNSWIQPEDYRYAYQQLDLIPESDRRIILEEQLESISHRADHPLLLSRERGKEFPILSELLRQAEHIEDYPSYLEEVQVAAKQPSIAIFRDASEFSVLNAQKTADDFLVLKGTELQWVNGHGFEKATESALSDEIIVLLLYYFIGYPILKNKETGLFHFLRTTPLGRTTYILSRIFIALIFSGVFTLLIWGSNYWLSIAKYGEIDLSAPLQSLMGYGGSGVSLTIGSFWIRFLLLKMLIYFLISLLFLWLSITASSGIVLYFRSVLIGLISYFMLQFIPVHSKLEGLRYINLISFIGVTPNLKHYINLNLFGQPVGIHQLYPKVLVLLILILISVILWEFGNHPVSISFQPASHKFWIRWDRIGSIVLQEGYKLLISQRGLLVLLVLLLSQIWLYSVKDISLGEQELYYRSFMNRLSGYWNPDKTKWVREFDRQFEEQKRIRDSALLRFEKGEIAELEKNLTLAHTSAVLKRESAFQKVQSRLFYLADQYRLEGRVLPVVYEEGALRVFGLSRRGYQEDMISAVFLLVPMITVLPSYYMMEKRTGLDGLIRTTYNGRRIHRHRKRQVGVYFTVFSFVITASPELLFVAKNLGLPDLSLNAYGIPEIANLRALPIFLRLLLAYGIRLAMALIVLWSVQQLANHMDNLIKVQSILTGVYLLPIALHLMGMKWIDFFSFNPLFSGNLLLNGEGHWWLLYLVNVAFGLYCFDRVCKRRN
ncbi:MAG: hypothetical protein Q4G61_05555 [Tissierellia bacterium]|nr:hypothetical protein [Tissierellia bacterium]